MPRRNRNTGNSVSPQRPYQLLPQEMRPRYTERSDLRLLMQAFRNGWVDRAPIERKLEWVEDILQAMGDESNCKKRTAFRAFLTILLREERLRESAISASMSPAMREALREEMKATK